MEGIRYRQYNPYTNSFHYWGYDSDECFIPPMEGSMFTQYNQKYIYINDENGEEIYEGDIVTTSQEVLHKAKYWQVVWSDAGMCYWLVNEYDSWKDEESEYGDLIFWGLLTVVGNIYENPELMEGNK